MTTCELTSMFETLKKPGILLQSTWFQVTSMIMISLAVLPVVKTAQSKNIRFLVPTDPRRTNFTDKSPRDESSKP